MDPTTAALAKAITTELLSGPGTWAIIILSTIGAGVGAYFGKYLQTKGQNWATKEDFTMLQEQLIASTRTVEAIKSDISKADWIEKEWKSIRIRKVEELFIAMHTAEDAVRSFKTANGADLPTVVGIVAKPGMIASLYLPELFEQVQKFAQHLSMRVHIVDEFEYATKNPKTVRSPDPEKVKSTILELSSLSNAAYNQIRNDARGVLIALVDGPPGDKQLAHVKSEF